MRCDVIAEGIIAAAKELNLVLPIIVRLQVKLFSVIFAWHYDQISFFESEIKLPRTWILTVSVAYRVQSQEGVEKSDL